jgi:S1-C subfamily serine protease
METLDPLGGEGQPVPGPEPAGPWVAPSPPRPRGLRRPWLRTAAAALAGAVAGGAAVAALGPGHRVWAQGTAGIRVVAVPPEQEAQGAAAVAVYKKLAPSIVLVTNNSTQQTFFGPQSTTAWGSGVIFSPDGYIVTNDHVVNGASSVTVTLSDGSTYPARFIGGDVSTDLAVIKIDPKGPLQAATFADSSAVQPGQVAIAIGNPLGPAYALSVTQGIVSAVRPMLYGFDPQAPRVTTMIQTDAPINPGNSGGALADAQGNVIGITSMKVAQTGESGVPAVGLGFAIPSNTVKKIVDQIVQYGYVKWAWLGVYLNSGGQSPLDQLPTAPQTVTVTSVVRGGPADGKLQPGDVIQTWNGQRVLNYYSLVGDVSAATPGQTVTIGVLRGGQLVQVQITLGTEPREQAEYGTQRPAQGPAYPPSPQPWPYPFPFPFPFPFNP